MLWVGVCPLGIIHINADSTMLSTGAFVSPFVHIVHYVFMSFIACSCFSLIFWVYICCLKNEIVACVLFDGLAMSCKWSVHTFLINEISSKYYLQCVTHVRRVCPGWSIPGQPLRNSIFTSRLRTVRFHHSAFTIWMWRTWFIIWFDLEHIMFTG